MQPKASRRAATFAAIGFVVASAATVTFLAEPASADLRWGLAGFLGYQGYTMDDVNSVIEQVNTDLSTPGDEARIDELSGDISFGGGVRVDLTPHIRLYGEYERLKDNTGGGTLVGSFSIDLVSDTFLAGGTYFFQPVGEGKTRLGLGAGVGYYSFGGDVQGDATWGTTTYTGTQDVGGSTVGFHGLGELDVKMSEKWHLEGALGYRVAKGEVQLNGQETGADLDWSGLMTRLGVILFVQ